MENKHSLGIISITGSKLLERFSYYGMRSMLLLYMLHTLNFSEEKMHSIYGTFSLIIGLTPLIGGIIGDWVLGSKRAAILGGFIQALGYFALCIPNNIGLYSGLGFIILGVGLYNPNILSQLSLVYRNKHQLIDSAILILYIGINIGAFTAPFLIGTIGKNGNYSTGFLLAGIAVCLSQVILIFTKNSPETILPEHKTTYKNTNLITLVLISLFLTIPLYWILFEHSDFIILKLFNNIHMDFNSSSFATTTQMINPFIIVFLGIILAVIWSFIKVSSVLKLSIGFIITAISCFLISHFIFSPTITFILLSIVLQSISELFISPIALSLICQYSPVKWQSTLMGGYLTASAIISYLGSYLIAYFERLSDSTSLIISTVILTLIALVYFILYTFIKNSNKEISPAP